MSISRWDESLLLYLNSWIGQSTWLDAFLSVIAVYSVYLVPVVLVYLWFKKVREAGVRATSSGLLFWLVVSPLIAAVWFRARPPLAELGGRELLFHRPTHSFPSDHAGFLAALTVSFYLNGYRNIAAAFFLLTIVVSLSRIIVGFHYPTDILGGWVIGASTAFAIHYVRDWFDRYLSRPAIRLAKKVRLA